MAEITELGYENLRRLIVDSIATVELSDDQGGYVVRINTSDDNVTWIHPTKEITVWDEYGNQVPIEVPDTQTLQLQVVVTGTDAGVTLPATFTGIKLEDATTGDVVSEETFTPFEMTQDADEITITHNIEVPQL
ncbi:hypothetical protein [Lentibacillus amyloliquefaciens]|uniref:Uncharacterized protein n=1 Tax=Lentibacillus amyloliquefaciens TaxID=1472767 RepID=A0A0U4E3K3_9BACI|nr:hypothetical protein [Lentibacillus amyloliquefaciens]ALX47852.1 hypothetical protein AOX59_04085 [Lentibacillus amyloliquefaciens]